MRRCSRPSRRPSIASRARSWRNPKTSGSVSTQEPAADEAAQHRDELALVHAGDRGQHVEGHPSAEHGGGLDHVALGRLEVVDLAAEDLGQVPRERLGAELLHGHATGRDQQLLEEEGVAAGAGVHASRPPGTGTAPP